MNNNEPQNTTRWRKAKVMAREMQAWNAQVID
jgi:hypothetical protein